MHAISVNGLLFGTLLLRIPTTQERVCMSVFCLALNTALSSKHVSSLPLHGAVGIRPTITPMRANFGLVSGLLHTYIASRCWTVP